MNAACSNSATAITPAQGILNSLWAPAIAPEISPAPAQGSIVVTNGGTPPSPIQRGIIGASGFVQVPSGLTAGALAVYALFCDGNWRQVANPLTLAASSSYSFSVAPGSVAGNWTFTIQPPYIALAFVVTTAITGANLTLMQILGMCRALDDPRGVTRY